MPFLPPNQQRQSTYIHTYNCFTALLDFVWDYLGEPVTERWHTWMFGIDLTVCIDLASFRRHNELLLACCCLSVKRSYAVFYWLVSWPICQSVCVYLFDTVWNSPWDEFCDEISLLAVILLSYNIRRGANMLLPPRDKVSIGAHVYVDDNTLHMQSRITISTDGNF